MFKMYALYREFVKYESPYQDGVSGNMIQLNKNEESFMLQEKKVVSPNYWHDWHNTSFNTVEELEVAFDKLIKDTESPYYWKEDKGHWTRFNELLKEAENDLKLTFQQQEITMIKLKDWKQGTGSRASGIEFRNLLIDFLERDEDPNIDFYGVSVISSGFADEVFGRLFIMYGPVRFATRINFFATNPTIDSLINKAIIERAKTT